MKARLGMCGGFQTSTATASPPTEGKLILPFWKDLLILEGLSDWRWRWREIIWWQALVPGHGNMQRLGPRGSRAYTAPWQDLTTLPHEHSSQEGTGLPPHMAVWWLLPGFMPGLHAHMECLLGFGHRDATSLSNGMPCKHTEQCWKTEVRQSQRHAA